jgi:hypothetical protein
MRRSSRADAAAIEDLHLSEDGRDNWVCASLVDA